MESQLTEERIREIIRQEIINNLNFDFDNYGYEAMGLSVKIEYEKTPLVDYKL